MNRNVRHIAVLAVCMMWFGAMAQAAEGQTAEHQHIELLNTLETKGLFVRLEGRSLFHTSDVKAKQAGYWLDIGTDPAAPVLVDAGLPGAWDVAVAGNYAFVCDYTNVLTVYEIKGPRWQQVAELKMPSPHYS